MRLSINWLSEFVSPDVAPKDLGDALTLSGSKVETVEDIAAGYQNIVVGRLLTLTRHPDADRLTVCSVDVGTGTIQIVTGAPNMKKDDLVAVALSGSRLPSGKEIHAGQLRGIDSDGMMCSLSELNLTLNDFPYALEDGLFILEEPCAPGDNVVDALGLRDHCLEFEITNNRPDCLSVIGLARECAATFDLPMKRSVPQVKGGGGDITSLLSVSVKDFSLCPRYTARMVRDIKIEPSPRWMRERLRASGVRPINNIVDITNYVMLEYGQPMHAFDHACLRENAIVVRAAKPGETLRTLDGKERSLTPDMLLICDAKTPVGVAGVMGGLDSEITEKTNTIVFESANFYGPTVRKTALALGFRTESSGRFEKGLDITQTREAVDRACELVELLGAGIVCDGVIDICETLPEARTIEWMPERVNALLGTNVPESEMVALLKRLGIEIEDGYAKIPSFRADLEGMADLTEEIARLYGYNRLPDEMPGGAVRGAFTPRQHAANRLHSTCRALGFSEVLTYSFTSPADFDQLGLPESHPDRRALTIENPLGEERSILRTTPLPSMLEILSRNQRSRNSAVLLYELAMTYRPNEAKPVSGAPQDSVLPIERPQIILAADNAGDFYKLKGQVETLLSAFRVSARFTPLAEHPALHPGRAAQILVGNQSLGFLGELHPDVADRYDLSGRICLAQIDFYPLYELADPETKYTPLPRFPAITRDLAVVCEATVPSDALVTCIRREAGSLLISCVPFDVYTGAPLSAGQKSVALSLALRADDRTLTDEEADDVVTRVLATLKRELNAELRR